MWLSWVLVSIFILAIPIGLGFCCRAVALNKHRPGGLWFGLGFFLGLLALVIIACLPDELANNQSNTWICLNCGTLNNEQNNYCSKCGHAHIPQNKSQDE